MKQINKKHLLFLIPIGILEIVMLVLECLPNGVEIQLISARRVIIASFIRISAVYRTDTETSALSLSVF